MSGQGVSSLRQDDGWRDLICSRAVKGAACSKPTLLKSQSGVEKFGRWRHDEVIM
jgi:hypothetical protein